MYGGGYYRSSRRSSTKNYKDKKLNIYCLCKKEKVTQDSQVMAVSNMIPSDKKQKVKKRITIRETCGECSYRLTGEDFEMLMAYINLMFGENLVK